MVLLFKPDHERGPEFRAPYSGYSLSQTARLIPIERVLSICATWPLPEAERIKPRGIKKQTAGRAKQGADEGPQWKAEEKKRDVPGGPADS